MSDHKKLLLFLAGGIFILLLMHSTKQTADSFGYQRGYYQAQQETYESAYKEGYADGLEAGWHSGYHDCMEDYGLE